MVGCVSPNLCFGSGKPYFELFPLVKLAKIPAKKFLKKIGRNDILEANTSEGNPIKNLGIIL